ncbi:MAG: ribosome maturation factor RimM [Acidobacteriaceae bacterium]
MSNQPHQQNWVSLAHLLRPQGRKGELLAELLTDFPERFSERKRVFLMRPSIGAAPAAPPTEYELEDFWLPVGKNAGRVVLKFAGVDSISTAELLKRYEVVIPEAERAALEEDAAYISDLVGCTVFDKGKLVGVVEDVDLPAAASQDSNLPQTAPLLVVAGEEGQEFLIPFAKAWLHKLDVGGKRIEMTLPEGLLDINAPLSEEEKRLAQAALSSSES